MVAKETHLFLLLGEGPQVPGLQVLTAPGGFL